jgi:2-polyprenyl-3-methyl-5-hydroxy-6-metoxy-1,4-benzoquinol methylase
MTAESSQLHTWSHFQNRAPEVFRANHPRLDFMLRTAGRLTPAPDRRLLNVGVGDGYLEDQALKAGWSVHALDPDAVATAKLRQRGIEAATGSIESMPFADGQFEIVVTSEVLEHLTSEEREKGLTEIARSLKSGGHLIGSVPYREDLQMNTDVCPRCRHVFHRWGHTTSFDLGDVRRMLAAHLTLVSCRRTAFVEFKGRDLRGKFESLARLTAAKLGLGSVNIFFVARKA